MLTAPVSLAIDSGLLPIVFPTVPRGDFHDEENFCGPRDLPGARAGNTIYTSQLVVGGEDDDGLTIVHSGATYSYSCVDKCRATPKVGDAPAHFQDVMTTVTGKHQSASGAH